MNILLWVLQIGLGLHTLMGAVWKFSHSAEQTMPSLKAIPSAVWLTMSVIEIVCGLALIAPLVVRSLAPAAPVAAVIIAIEMVAFTALHLAGGNGATSAIAYWLVVAAICAFVAYGRWALSPVS